MERSEEEKTGAQLERGGSGGSRRHRSSHLFSRNALFSFPILVSLLIEKALRKLSAGKEKILGIIDLRGFGTENADLKFLIFLFDVLYYYYPKRLGEVLFVDPPFVFKPIWQLAKPLVKSYASLLAISSPSREVLLTLARSGVVELIGKEWYFVRMHDVVQVCLQHVQSLNETPKASDSSLDHKPSFFQILLNKREEDSSTADLESCNKMPSGSKYLDPHLELLLSRKS